MTNTTTSQMAHVHALVDVKEAAAAIGLTPVWIRQLISKGELRGINVGGHGKAARWRVDPDDLMAWMKSRENRPRDTVTGQVSA